MSVSGTMAEYLVKLGVQLDEKNMEKLEGFLKSSKISATALKDALKAAATAVYTFVKSFADTEEELARIAKEHSKTVETVRAEQTALKALGKTLQEVNRDGELRKTYEELVAINKEMALPNTQHVMDALGDLSNAFAALKSTVQYGLEWIRYYTLSLLKGPMKQFQDYFTRARQWLQINMKVLSQRVGVILSDFLKGLSGIIDTAGRLLGYLDRLPDGFKAGIAAVAGFAAALKSGPVGQLLMAVSLIGDLMLDYENYKTNLSEGTNIGVALPGIWEVLEDDSLTGTEKAAEIMSRITQAITGSADGFALDVADWLDLNTPAMTKVIEDLTGLIQGGVNNAFDIAAALMNGVQTVIGNNGLTDQLGESFRELFTTILGGVNDIGGAFATGLLRALSGKSNAEWEETFGQSADNEVLGGIGAGLLTAMFASMTGAKPGQSLVAGIAVGLGSMIVDAINDSGDQMFAGLDKDLASAAEQIWKGLSDGLGRVNSIGNDVAKLVVTALTGMSEADWMDVVGSGNTVIGGLTSGVVLALLGANGPAALAGGLITAISNAFSEAEQNSGNGVDVLWEDVKGFGRLLWGGITKGFGKLSDWWNDEETQTELNTIGEDINKVLFGEVGKDGKRSGGFFDQIKALIEDIKDSELFQTLYNTFDAIVLTPIKNAVFDIVDEIGRRFLAALPAGLKSALGIEDVTWRTNNKETGTVTYQSTNGGSVTVSKEIADYLATKGAVELDANGNFTIPGLLDANSGLAGTHRMIDFYNALSLAAETGDLESFVDLYEAGIKRAQLHAQYGTNNGNGYSDFVDKVNSYKNYSGLVEPATAEATVESNAEEATAAVNETAKSLQSLDGTKATATIDIQAIVSGLSGEDLDYYNTRINNGAYTPEEALEEMGLIGQNAYGGRFDSATYGEFGEDGTEYIIPITKPARAAELIRRMFGEMGSSATRGILNALGVGGLPETIGGSLPDAAGLLTGTGTVINYNNQVSAPVTITVQPGAASAEAVGQTVYSYAERALLQTVQGVLA